jgi:PhnB protein
MARPAPGAAGDFSTGFSTPFSTLRVDRPLGEGAMDRETGTAAPLTTPVTMPLTAPLATSVTTSVAPMLSVRDGARAVEFYKGAFGAAEAFRIDAPDGAVVARLSIDGAEFWVADESPAHENYSPRSLGGGTVRMILTVPDPDAAFARAVAGGARAVVAVEEAYGWRLGRVEDPFGHHWEIGRPLGASA